MSVSPLTIREVNALMERAAGIHLIKTRLGLRRHFDTEALMHYVMGWLASALEHKWSTLGYIVTNEVFDKWTLKSINHLREKL